jgi:YggT family protein
VLRPIRRLVGFRVGIDISPLIAILGIMFIRRFLVQSLFEMSGRM